MTDPRLPVNTLCARAVTAGLAPAAVARWGRLDRETQTTFAGHAVLRPALIRATEKTLFDLASLTKPLATTTMIVQASRQGVFGLETRVAEVLTELAGTAVGEIRVENLLTHTAGLPAWLPLYCLADGNPDLLIRRLGGVEVARPGTRVVYSCVGFVLLGKMLEAVSGQDLATLFRSEIAAPLGIAKEIGFQPDPQDARLTGGAGFSVVETRMVVEMGFDPALIPPVGPGRPDDGNARFLGGAAGNAGLFGSLDGLFSLALEWTGPGRSLLTAEEIASAIAPRTAGLGQTRGLGWQLASSPGCSAGPALDERAYGHTGFSGVSLWIDPTTASIFTLLTNRNHPAQRDIELHPLRRRFHQLAAASSV